MTPTESQVEEAEKVFQQAVPDGGEDVAQATGIPVPVIPRGDVNVKRAVSRIEGRASSKAANPEKKHKGVEALLGSVLAIDIANEHIPNPTYEDDSSTMRTRVAEAFLVKKAVNKEVKWKNLASGKRREAYLEAMAKEWKAWNDYGSVQVLGPDAWAQVRKTCPDLKTVPTRWVLVDKNESKRGNASYEAVPEFAKARLVVVGCFEKDQNIRKDSPTGSTLGFYMVCSKCASKRWRLRLLDAHNAFLQSGELERLLIPVQ